MQHQDSLSSKTNYTLLQRGEYLAPNFQTEDFQDFLVGSTSYNKEVKTGAWHCHENPMISFVLYGQNMEYRKGSKELRVPGSVNFYHSYELHKNIYETFPSKHISVEITKDFLNSFSYTESDILSALNYSETPQLILSRIFKESIIVDQHSEDSIQILLLSFLELSKSRKNFESNPPWVKQLGEILQDNWSKTISLKELSDELNLHPTTISKYFVHYFQSTLGAYMRKLKIQRALPMLMKSELSLTQIAYICGFSDQSHFTRVFKSETGYLPKDYRKL